MIDGKMQDDATVKQCQVVVELADALAARDPELAELTPTRRTGGPHMTDHDPAPAPLGALHARRQRAGPGEGEGAPRRRAHPRPGGRRRARRQGGGPRAGRAPRSPAAATATASSPSGSTASARRGTPTTSPPPPRPGPTRSWSPRSTPPRTSTQVEAALEAAGAPDRTRDLGDGRDAVGHARRRADRRGLRAADRAGDGHQRPAPRNCTPSTCPAARRCSTGLVARACSPPARSRQGRSSTASTTTSRTSPASRPSASRAGSSASTARR